MRVRVIEVSAGRLVDQEFPLLVASLHALKRRYERSFPRDLDVLNDLCEVASHFRGIKGADFRVPAGAGIWRSEMADLDGVPVIGAKTYVVPFLPGKPELFEDRLGALRARWGGGR